jgi:hypothetical protein
MMSRIWKSLGVAAFAATLVIVAQPQAVSAATVDYAWATRVVSYNPAGSVAANRQIAANALGSPTATVPGSTVNFCTLGIGGQIILRFDTPFTNDMAIVYETTYGNPASCLSLADLFVSQKNNLYVLVGKVFYVPNSEGGYKISLAGIPADGPFHYLKLVDTSSRSQDSDGFDLNAVGVTPATAVPFPAAGWAGLSLLGGLGVAKWRRTRNA